MHPLLFTIVTIIPGCCTRDGLNSGLLVQSEKEREGFSRSHIPQSLIKQHIQIWVFKQTHLCLCRTWENRAFCLQYK